MLNERTNYDPFQNVVIARVSAPGTTLDPTGEIHGQPLLFLDAVRMTTNYT